MQLCPKTLQGKVLFLVAFFPCLLGGLPAQKKPKKGPSFVLTPLGKVRILDNKEAKNLLKEIRPILRTRTPKKKKGKKTAPKDKGFLRRMEIVEKLETLQHPDLVPVLENVILRDPTDIVRTKAARALLAQPKKEARSSALKLLRSKVLKGKGSIQAPLIRILTRFGAPKKVWKDLRESFLDLGPLAQIAFLESIEARRDWDSVDLLLDHLDPPSPSNVDARENPPAEYWERRWKAWKAFKPTLLKAIETLFGRSFPSKKEAKTWIKEQGGLSRIRKKQ
jgi:hypothetical protein